ncbi:hypothetical protein [Chitinophaga nivalis]|uniref:Dual-action HEIGH metallo-peptidase n=1 Tax=Chitinophaga nivalis TaxID=2991709 RepID=A0ABT3IS83_9BACT|nr:hypothetical protein [Chitinophaga nivalis]MCW3463468.1 hypothetical protein [Chitinophaga nivalis]MCW3486842.1 hypothetical protein [Chitinophaga nivalis]
MPYKNIILAALLFCFSCSKSDKQQELSFENNLTRIKVSDNIWFNKKVDFSKSKNIRVFVDNRLSGADGNVVAKAIHAAIPVAQKYLSQLSPNINITSITYGDVLPALGTTYDVVIRADNSGVNAAPAWAHIPDGTGNVGDLMSVNLDVNQTNLSWAHVYYTRLIIHEFLHILGYGHTGAVSSGDYDANVAEMAIPNVHNTVQEPTLAIMSSYGPTHSLIGYSSTPADFDAGTNPFYVFTKGDLAQLNWYYSLKAPYDVY